MKSTTTGGVMLAIPALISMVMGIAMNRSAIMLRTNGWNPAANNNRFGFNRPNMSPNFGRAVGASGATSMPYAGGASGVAGPASAARGMSQMQPSPMRRSMLPNAMQAQPQVGGVNPMQGARNVLMGQPHNADTSMRPLNIPGSQHRYAARGITPGGMKSLMPGVESYRRGPMMAASGVSPDEYRVGMGGEGMVPPSKAISRAAMDGGRLNGISGGNAPGITANLDQRRLRMEARRRGVSTANMDEWARRIDAQRNFSNPANAKVAGPILGAETRAAINAVPLQDPRLSGQIGDLMNYRQHLRIY